MLSSEIASRLAGRSINIQVHPLTYIEFLDFHSLTDSDESLGLYLRYEDLGIRNAIIGYRPQDIGGLMENAVYNHLIARGYKVSVGAMPKGREIDFVAEKDNEYRYVQVAVRVGDRKTAECEFGNLENIRDNYPKIVVTLNDFAPNTDRGIRMMSLRQLLLQ